jgi:hypothetical protein
MFLSLSVGLEVKTSQQAEPNVTLSNAKGLNSPEFWRFFAALRMTDVT